MDRLTRFWEALATIGLGALAPAVVQAVTSWWNRDAAKAQLEAERLRQQKEDDDDER